MARLEDLTRGAHVTGVLPEGPVTVVDSQWYGTGVVELTYRDAASKLGSELIYRDREPSLRVAADGQLWAFDADGAKLRLVSEAYRIRLAHLFDPLLAVHTSLVDPLPHQITAVYGEMLLRQPLCFLLADDPGAGKTIMTGLLIKELLLRGDLHRCLIVCPGSLVEQWQDELSRRFDLPSNILTRDTIEAARSSSPPIAPPVALPHRFYGTVRLAPTRLNSNVSEITQEVIQHLAGLIGVEVEITPYTTGEHISILFICTWNPLIKRRAISTFALSVPVSSPRPTSHLD